jgi:hypothetical protein
MFQWWHMLFYECAYDNTDVSITYLLKVLSLFHQQALNHIGGVRSLDLTAHTSLSPVRRWFASSFVDNNKGCTRLAVVSDEVYKLLAQDRWFSPVTPASSISYTSHHDTAQILLKLALNTINQINQIKSMVNFDP